MSFKIRLPNLQNVAPGNTATLKLPVSGKAPTVDQIVLELTNGLTPAHIESIRGKINGSLFYEEGSGTILNARDSYRGVFQAAGFLTIDFTEPKARNGAVEQLLSSIPLSRVQDLQFELQIAAAAPAAGRISAEMNCRPPTANEWILKKKYTTESFAGAGEQIIYLPTGNAGGKIKRIWIHENTAGTITSLDLRIGNNSAFETTRTRLEHMQRRFELVPQAGVVVLDAIEDGNLSGILDTKANGEVQLRLTSSAANTYRVWYELIDPIAN